MAVAGTPIIGRGGEFAISSDGVTYTKVGGVTTTSADFNVEEVDVTDYDSAGFKEIILGDKSGEVTLNLIYEEDADAQITLANAFWNGTKMYGRLRPQTGNTKVEIKGQFYVTSWPMDIPENSKMAQTVKIKFTGTITFDRDQTT